MAYSALPSKSASDTLTLGNYNAIKGNFEAGCPDLVAAKGDLCVGTAVDAAARLAAGPNDATLVSDSTAATGLEWQIQPIVKVRNSGNIDPATSTWVALTFDTEDKDTDAMHSTSSNTERLTVPTDGDGVYLIGGCARFDTSGTATGSSIKGVRIIANGTTVIASTLIDVIHASYDIEIHVSGIHHNMTAGDYVELEVYTNQDHDVQGGGAFPQFWAIWQRRP